MISLILDLTKNLDQSVVIYTDGAYSDPPFSCRQWCSVEDQGYAVSALTLGTQTGTHIDAPSHFDVDGESFDSLALDKLIGSFFIVDIHTADTAFDVEQMCKGYRNELILFVRCINHDSVSLSSSALKVLMQLPPDVWIIAGNLSLVGAPPLEFHRAIAQAGKYLIEDIDYDNARRVVPGGELIALPLSLRGTSGAPCRVVVRYPDK